MPPSQGHETERLGLGYFVNGEQCHPRPGWSTALGVGRPLRMLVSHAFEGRGSTKEPQQRQLHSSNQRHLSPAACPSAAHPARRGARATPAAWPAHVDARPGTKPLGPSQQAKRTSGKLNNTIKHAKQLWQLEQALTAHSRDMDAVHVAALCSQLVKAPAMMQQLAARSRDQQQAFVAALSSSILDLAHTMAPRQSSTLLWALGKLALLPVKASKDSTADIPLKQLLQRSRPHRPQWPAVQPLQHGHDTAGADPFAAPTSALLQRLAATTQLASGQDVALALHGAAQQLHQPSDPELAQLLSRMQHVLPACRSQDLSMCIHSLATLNRAPTPTWMAAFLQAAQPKLQACSCQALSNIAWALATLEQAPRPNRAWLSTFSQASGQCMALFSDRELSTMVWALGKMDQHPGPGWMSLLEAEATERAPTMSDQDLDMVLAAMARLGHRPGQALLSQLSAQLMARSSRGLLATPSGPPGPGPGRQGGSGHGGDGPVAAGPGAALGDTRGAAPPPGVVPGMSTAGGRQLEVGQSGSSHAASLPAPAGHVDTALAERMEGGLRVALRGSSGAGPAVAGRLEARAACDILTSLVRLQVVPSQALLDSLLTGLTPSLAHMKAGDLVAVLHAMARLHYRPRKRWLARLLRLLRLRLPGMGAAQLAGLLWSLARLGIRPEDRWISWVLLECQRKLPESRPQELANMAWALARLGYQPRPRWLLSFFHHTALRLHSFKVQELAMMAEAVARGRFAPPQPWVVKLNSELTRRVKPGVNSGMKKGSGGSLFGQDQLELGQEGGLGAEHAAAAVCHKEVYAVLRALARMEGGSRGCLPARASTVPCEGALLMAANMASLRLIKGHGARSYP